MTDDIPTESAGVIYHEIDYGTQYDQSDGAGIVVTIIDAVATV